MRPWQTAAVDLQWEHRVRTAVFAWLRRVQAAYPDAIPAAALREGTVVDGRQITVMSHGLGIWKPRVLDAAISVMTTPPKADEPPPYYDAWIDSTRLSYAYQGDDPEQWTNRALRLAWEHQLPLVYLYGVRAGWYLAEFPVYVARDRPADLRVDLVFGAERAGEGIMIEVDGREYRARETRARLHQHGFRTRVVTAYGGRCAMCALRQVPLLDAAHIVPDGEPTGLPITRNGLALCKIHHAAYDQAFIGVRPDLVIEVDRELLDEIDGPILKHGLQQLHRQQLRAVPRRKVDHPDPERLEWRYSRFRQGRQLMR